MMTNKDKILRYLECGLKVKATNEEGDEYIIYAKEIGYHYDEYFIAYSVDFRGANIYPLDAFEQYTITPIPTKPNYRAGDLVTILPIAREANRYDDWHKVAKDMIESGVCEIKLEGNGHCSVYTKNKSDYWYFPTWALAPAFPDEASYTGKEIAVTIDGKEYKAIIQ